MFDFKRHSQLPDVLIIDGKQFNDKRGFFSESFRADEFLSQGIPPFVQENHSHSKALTLRGLHYQLNPKAQGKLIMCAAGAILDVAVDIRKGSPTYGQSIAISLISNVPRMLYIPPGFAHGFVVENWYPYSAEVIYKTTEYYSPEHERSIRWDDPDLNVSWNVSGGNKKQFIISDKDFNAPLLKDAENNFVWKK